MKMARAADYDKVVLHTGCRESGSCWNQIAQKPPDPAFPRPFATDSTQANSQPGRNAELSLQLAPEKNGLKEPWRSAGSAATQLG